MPRHFHIAANVAYARLSSLWTSKKAVDRWKGERAGIGYSKRCQNISIYIRAWLNLC